LFGKEEERLQREDQSPGALSLVSCSQESPMRALGKKKKIMTAVKQSRVQFGTEIPDFGPSLLTLEFGSLLFPLS
jgi:hypothetical protein